MTPRAGTRSLGRMDALTLVIGSRNYSSWSLRPWLLMRALGLAFEETVVQLREPDTKSTLLQYSPAGKVPILIDGEATVWESIAIMEYLAEKHPEAMSGRR